MHKMYAYMWVTFYAIQVKWPLQDQNNKKKNKKNGEGEK